MGFVSVVVVVFVVFGALFWAVFGGALVESLKTHHPWDD